MRHLATDILTRIRVLVGSAGLTIGGQAVAVTRMPEAPPYALDPERGDYPLVALEVAGQSAETGLDVGHQQGEAVRINVYVVAHASNVDGHPTISSPWEYVRRGAEAVDDTLSAAGPRWGIEGVVMTRWTDAGPYDEELAQGLWAYRTTWEVLCAT